jgi:ATPase, YjeE family
MEYKETMYDEKETIELAENFESEKFKNMVICLNGDLGAGKTVFVKGFASALGIDEVITSPTFNIVKEYYSGEMPLFHMDVYRLDEGNVEIDFDEYFTKKGVTIIEWSDLIKDKLPKQRLEITIKIVDENTRILVIKPFGKKYEDLCEAVL